MKVFVTGIGVVSSLGNNASENFASLKGEKTGISKFYESNLDRNLYAGLVNLSNQELAELCGYSNTDISRTSLLGLLAVKECWGNNQLSSDLRTGLISGTSVGGMDKTEIFYRNKLNNEPADFKDLQYHDSGNTTEKIADVIGFSGYVNTISTACSSGSNAIMNGARMILADKLDRVIVGGVDALTQFTISGFSSLMIYNEELCKPFDENRQGLNLGEGAGFLLLESEESQKNTQNTILGVVDGWANTADAFHQTATSPMADGATLAMNGALEKANLTANAIDYVNAHGTGTKNNDLTESVALKNVFGDNIPAFSSTKAYTGHTLAASGAIEAVFSILALQNKVIYPNLRFTDCISETALVPQKEFQTVNKIEHIMSNSFGFGGNCTSLVFSDK